MSMLNRNLIKKLALMVPVMVGLTVAGISAAGSSIVGDVNPNQIYGLFESNQTCTAGTYSMIQITNTVPAVMRTTSNITQANPYQIILAKPAAYRVFWEVSSVNFKGGEQFGLSYGVGGRTASVFNNMDFIYTRTGCIGGTKTIISDTIVTSTGGTRLSIQNVGDANHIGQYANCDLKMVIEKIRNL